LSYYAYTQRIARDCEKAEGDERRAAAALKDRKVQARKSLQPEYSEISNWMSAQIKEHGLTGEMLATANARIATLDAIVAATI
jgi:hypothetical protein